MATFKDRNGRQWIVEINVGTLKRVRQSLGIDLMDILGSNGDGENSLLAKMGADPALLVQVIFEIITNKGEVTDDQFMSGFAGQVIVDATEAFIEALVDFFPPSKGNLLAKAWEKLKEIDEKMVAEAHSQLGLLSGSLQESAE